MSWTLEEAISYYQSQGASRDQNTLISLLKEIQSHSEGSIPRDAVTAVARNLQVKEGLVLALIRRIPSLRLGDRHSLVLCAGPNCGKAAALAAAAEELCQQRADTVTLTFSPCMRMCGKGPNLKWDGTIYHNATPELLRSLLK